MDRCTSDEEMKKAHPEKEDCKMACDMMWEEAKGEKSFIDAEGQSCPIVFMTREAYLNEQRPYANEHA